MGFYDKEQSAAVRGRYLQTGEPTGPVTIASVTVKRLYTGAVTGTIVVGATLAQATSLATGVVLAIRSGSIDVGTITGTFDATHVVTATNPDTSTATFTPTMTLIDVWTPVNKPLGTIVATNNSLSAMTQVVSTVLLTAGKFRYQQSLNQIETLTSDGWTSLSLQYSGQ